MSKTKSKKTIAREKHKEWREAVLKRDNYICRVCNTKPNKPHVHHIFPAQFKELKYDVRNGITLCFRHHKVDKYSAHMNAVWFYYWLKNNIPKQLEYLKNKFIDIGERLK